MTAAADRRYVEQATRQFEAALHRVVVDYEHAGQDVRVALGSPGALAERVLRSVAPVASPWDDLVGPFLRSDGVQARLGISRQAVAAKAGRRRLLRVITSDGEHLYPVWQFDGNRPVAGLPAVLAQFAEDDVDGWTLAAWLRTPEPELGDAPLTVLCRGDAERVNVAARHAAARLAA